MSEKVSFPSVYVNGLLIDCIPDTISYSLIDGLTIYYKIRFQTYNMTDILLNNISWANGFHDVRIRFNTFQEPVELIFSQCDLTLSDAQLGPSGRITTEFKGALIS